MSNKVFKHPFISLSIFCDKMDMSLHADDREEKAVCWELDIYTESSSQLHFSV